MFLSIDFSKNNAKHLNRSNAPLFLQGAVLATDCNRCNRALAHKAFQREFITMLNKHHSRFCQGFKAEICEANTTVLTPTEIPEMFPAALEAGTSALRL